MDKGHVSFKDCVGSACAHQNPKSAMWGAWKIAEPHKKGCVLMEVWTIKWQGCGHGKLSGILYGYIRCLAEVKLANC